MLLNHLDILFECIFSLALVAVTCAASAYIANARRPDEDSQKRTYHPVAILLAPVTLPLLVVLSISLFILRVIFYGIFLIMFAVALLIVRKPFLFTWLRKMSISIGAKLLETNLLLIKLFLKPWANRS